MHELEQVSVGISHVDTDAIALRAPRRSTGPSSIRAPTRSSNALRSLSVPSHDAEITGWWRGTWSSQRERRSCQVSGR